MQKYIFFLFFIFVYFYLFIYFMGIQFLCNVVLVSIVQQSESAIYLHTSPLFQISFPFRSSQSLEYSSVCYTGGSCYLFCIQQCIYVSPSLPIHPTPPYPCNIPKFVLYIWVSLFANKFIYIIFLDSTYRGFRYSEYLLNTSQSSYFSLILKSASG